MVDKLEEIENQNVLEVDSYSNWKETKNPIVVNPIRVAYIAIISCSSLSK